MYFLREIAYIYLFLLLLVIDINSLQIVNKVCIVRLLIGGFYLPSIITVCKIFFSIIIVCSFFFSIIIVCLFFLLIVLLIFFFYYHIIILNHPYYAVLKAFATAVTGV